MNIKLKQSISLEDLKILKDSVFKFQEVLLFKPDQYKGKLQNTSDFNYEEYYFTVDKDIRLHGVLFKTTTKCKGVIFYLHGNKAIINNLDISLKFYLEQGYDLFTWDYRGYGKSDSEIKNESEFYADAQKVFSEFYQQSSYEHFIMLGYSLGTGLAIKLAADNSELIDLLILKAPYYSIVEVVRQRFFRFAPKQFIKYPLESYKYINQVKA
ncbi:MAG: lysophospholipase, partial [Neisseriaceae bacterium]|nr:lysophospholipase [Neisseriaceae bacterium]